MPGTMGLKLEGAIGMRILDMGAVLLLHQLGLETMVGMMTQEAGGVEEAEEIQEVLLQALQQVAGVGPGAESTRSRLGVWVAGPAISWLRNVRN